MVSMKSRVSEAVVLMMCCTRARCSLQVCQISYARIQGRAALVSHFQNSSLMHEDKRCRPVLFTSDGVHAGEQEPFPVGPNVRPRGAHPSYREGRAGGGKP